MARKQSITDIIEELMQDGNEWSPYQIQSELRKRGRYHSDATISRRMRDLRDRNYNLTWHFIPKTTNTLYKINKIDNICAVTHKAGLQSCSLGI